MRSTFNILFYLNTSKRKKTGLCPLMGRITVDGGISQFSLKADVHPDNWDTKKGRAKGKSSAQIALNRKIEQTAQTIRDIYARTVEATGYITAEQIKNELNGTTAKAANLLELYREHNADYQKRIGIDRNVRTYLHYKNSLNHLSRFILSKYDLRDYPMKQLDMPFIESYDLYLRTDAQLCTNSMIKQIKHLKKIVSLAINQRIIIRDPFSEYVPEKQKSKYLHISKTELERIITTPIQSQSVSFVRDMFVFSCFTGLAYADMRQLSEKHIHKLPDDSVWIKISRLKTDIECNIRLLDIPLAIIEKYRHERNGEPLLKIQNSAAVSRNMREIEKLCDINHLHFHMARHTFATLICLTNGVSMEAVSKMMGHNSMRTTQIYAEITSQKVCEDMKNLEKRIKSKKPQK